MHRDLKPSNLFVERGIVADADGEAVVADLKSRWFGERTVRGTIEALAQRRP